MRDENLIRKTIFKNELYFIFEKNNVCKAEEQKIVFSIFENPLEISKQYILKEEVSKLEALDRKLNQIIDNKELVGAIKTLFIVQEDLKLPSEISKLFLKNEKVAIFVGAGISKLIGFPLWDELANKAIEYLHKQNLITYFEYQKIMREVSDPKQKMTIFDALIPRYRKEAKNFYTEIFSKPNYKNGNPYEILIEFDCLKITTNVDKEFYNALDKKLRMKELQERAKMIEIQNLSINNINNNAIYHIHGSIDKLEQTVLTTKDYIEAYYIDKSPVRTFLSDVFREYTVIFVGYGLSEFPILEHIIGKENYHYALIPSYLNEINLFKLQQKYFENLHIKPIPFFLDFNGYNRLVDVLDSWIQQLSEQRQKDYYQKIRIIDEVID